MHYCIIINESKSYVSAKCLCTLKQGEETHVYFLAPKYSSYSNDPIIRAAQYLNDSCLEAKHELFHAK